jgi:hypothetical protein
MDTNRPEYINPTDIRAAALEQLDEWFPAWRKVTDSILRLGAAKLAEQQQAQPEGTPSATLR